MCGSGSCPTIYLAADGSYIIQGRTIDADLVNVSLGDGESLVAIPGELLTSMGVPKPRSPE